MMQPFLAHVFINGNGNPFQTHVPCDMYERFWISLVVLGVLINFVFILNIKLNECCLKLFASVSKPLIFSLAAGLKIEHNTGIQK